MKKQEVSKSSGERSMSRPWLKDFFDVQNFFDMPDWFRGKSRNVPAVNVSEDAKNYNVDVVAPGFKKDDFNVRLDEDMITISAESKRESKEEDKEYSRMEYECNSFTRSFSLPENARHENINANYSDGILHLTIPKTEETKSTPPKTIPIR